MTSRAVWRRISHGGLRTGVAAVSLFAACGSCDRSPPEDAAAQSVVEHPGVRALEAGSPELAGTAGQTIYVPAYSAVGTADNLKLLYQLAITLSVRNTDRSLPIVITAVRYHRHDGRLVRDYLKSPQRVDPLAALEVFVREGDTSGGSASSFVVDWVGDPAATAPIVESVMVGTAGTQGISFTCPGRVVADRGH